MLYWYEAEGYSVNVQTKMVEEGGEGRLLRASEGVMNWCMHIGKGYRTLYVGRWNIHMLRPFQRGDTSNGVLMIEWNGMSQR